MDERFQDTYFLPRPCACEFESLAWLFRKLKSKREKLSWVYQVLINPLSLGRLGQILSWELSSSSVYTLVEVTIFPVFTTKRHYTDVNTLSRTVGSQETFSALKRTPRDKEPLLWDDMDAAELPPYILGKNKTLRALIKVLEY